MPANRRILVGIFAAGGFVLFALGLFWIGDRRLLFSESIELETRFSNMSGLKAGSKVMVSGMDAGEVLTIYLPARPAERFRVRFRVLASFRPMLRKDSVASIQVEGLVGSKVLQVDAGSDTAAPVEPGVVIPSREPIEIGAVIQQSVDLIRKVDGAVGEVEERVLQTIDTINDVGERARKLVIDVGGDTGEILAAGKKVARDVDTLVEGVRQGRGLAGKLLTDEQIYTRAASAARHVETAAANASRTTEDVRKMVADIESRKLGETFEKTAGNVRQATAHLTDILAEIRPPGGPDERGLIDDVRDSLANTREATSDMAENMEALKRNWFFRGFFNKRGFFDLDAVSLEDYRRGKIVAGRDPRRSWLHAQDLFRQDAQGRESLSDTGLKKLGEVIAPYLRHAPNTVLMVEGYSGQGTEPEQFLHSRDRARLVRRYLIDRFGLKPSYTGAMPMGAVSTSGPAGVFYEGVALVFFPEKKK